MIIKTVKTNKMIKSLNSIWNKFNKYNKVSKTKKSSLITKKINDYVSGTTVKNYLMQDPILDWFDEYDSIDSNKSVESNKYDCIDSNKYNSKKTFKLKKYNHVIKKNDDSNILFKFGNQFEKNVNDNLKEKYGDKVIDINIDGKCGCVRENYQKTIDEMMLGREIILQGVVFNDYNKTLGTFDLIVRSDFINTIVSRQVLSEEMETFKAPKLNGNYHYIVIDIKWTTMTLCSNGYNIRNSGRFPSYKGQLAIYNCAVGNIQGYIPPKAYIMSKSWKIDKKNNIQEGYNVFDLLGEIDYENFDNKVIDNTIKAIDWIRCVRTFGDTWDLHNPTVPEMYPNCSNKLDYPWSKKKQDIADKIGELTNIWYVTTKQRNNAHIKGIKSWKNNKCNGKLLGLTNEKERVVNEILKINRSDNLIISPNIIQNNDFDWKNEQPTDFYIDFETINYSLVGDKIDILNSTIHNEILFMIGLGFVQNNKFEYKVFYLEQLTFEDEKIMFNEFINFLNNKIIQLDSSKSYIPRLFHWGFAEQNNVNHINKKHYNCDNFFSNYQWVNMYDIFTKEPIVIKDVFNFKLKNIGKSMFKHNLIKTSWDISDDNPSDGLGAMFSAIECYNKNNIKSKKFKSIVEYNKIDCKILYEILCYLRKNH
jgi:hypothetical protein